MGLCELPEEPGLPHTWLADDRHHLALTIAGPLQRLAEDVQLGVPPHKAASALARGSLQSCPHRPRAGHLIDFQRARSGP